MNWNYKTPGIPDEFFDRIDNVPITKEEIRSIVSLECGREVDELVDRADAAGAKPPPGTLRIVFVRLVLTELDPALAPWHHPRHEISNLDCSGAGNQGWGLLQRSD